MEEADIYRKGYAKGCRCWACVTQHEKDELLGREAVGMFREKYPATRRTWLKGEWEANIPYKIGDGVAFVGVDFGKSKDMYVEVADAIRRKGTRYMTATEVADAINAPYGRSPAMEDALTIEKLLACKREMMQMRIDPPWFVPDIERGMMTEFVRAMGLPSSFIKSKQESKMKIVDPKQNATTPMDVGIAAMIDPLYSAEARKIEAQSSVNSYKAALETAEKNLAVAQTRFSQVVAAVKAIGGEVHETVTSDVKL